MQTRLGLVVLISFSFYIITFNIINPVFAQSTNTATTQSSATSEADDSELDPNLSYCFEFTWMGPLYDNTTRYNGTCSDYLDSNRAKDVPCSPPLVITFDSTPPDINYLWNNHRKSVLCKRARGYVCASYTFLFDGHVENATYMCTKVFEDEKGAIKSGCYTQYSEGYQIELCVCESSPGIYKPCNSASWMRSSVVTLSLLMIVMIYF